MTYVASTASIAAITARAAPAGSCSRVVGWTVTSTIGASSARPRSPASSSRDGRSSRAAASNPGAPTTWTLAGSSPIAITRWACSSWLTRWRWLSFVIAWRSASSKAPRVCSPPWRWMIGTRSRVAASAAAAVSSRSPTSSSASGGRLPQRRPDRFERRRGLGGGGRVLGRVVVAGPRQDDVGFEAVRPDVVDGVPVSCREVRPADEQPQLELGVRPDRDRRRVQDPPVLAAGREDGDGLHASPSSTIAPARTGRAVGRPTSSCIRAGEMPVPGRCASRSPSAMVSPADRSRAQCRLRRATAAISRSAAVGTLSPSPIASAVARIGRDHRRELGRLERHRVIRPACESGRGSGASR